MTGSLADIVDEINKRRVSEMTSEEATSLVRQIVNGSQSADQIRTRLTDAGFNGGGAAVRTTRSKDGQMFMAMVMVWGPHGVISV